MRRLTVVADSRLRQFSVSIEKVNKNDFFHIFPETSILYNMVIF